MKVYSLFLLLKKISFFGIIIFFINFIICWILQTDFNIMIVCTMPFILITFGCYCAVCIIEDFLPVKKYIIENKRNIVKRQDFEEFERYSAC